MSLATETIASLRRRLQAGEITPSEIVQDVASAIEAKNAEIGAYLSWDTEAALAEAATANAKGPLRGIPVAIKDNINVTGQPCTCGSRILAENYRAPYDATSITQLRAAGVIPFGRLNMDEFAMGSSTENSALGVTRNPWDTDRIPGGSSGGSAASVASKTAIASLGSDTGGSIRQPAALCGVVGVKPTYGRVSRFGLVAFASSLDQIGTLTQTVEDSALLLNHLCGYDPRDSTSLDVAVPDFTALLGQDIKGLRIGMPPSYITTAVAPRGVGGNMITLPYDPAYILLNEDAITLGDASVSIAGLRVALETLAKGVADLVRQEMLPAVASPVEEAVTATPAL